MYEMVMVMAFQTYQFGRKQRQTKRSRSDDGVFRMCQQAAVACQPVRQPEIRAVQDKRQALRMRHLNVLYADKQPVQCREFAQHQQSLMKLCGFYRVTVVPEQRRADIEVPAQPVGGNIPVVG